MDREAKIAYLEAYCKMRDCEACPLTDGPCNCSTFNRMTDGQLDACLTILGNANRPQLNATIIVQCNAYITNEKLREFQQDLVDQAKDGIIVLPACCSLQAVLQGGDNILMVEALDKKK